MLNGGWSAQEDTRRIHDAEGPAGAIQLEESSWSLLRYGAMPKLEHCISSSAWGAPGASASGMARLLKSSISWEKEECSLKDVWQLGGTEPTEHYGRVRTS